MNEKLLTPRLKHQLGILRRAGVHIPDGARILDVGCGEGRSVRALRDAGFDAWGCDVAFDNCGALYDPAGTRSLVEQGYLRPISLQPYRFPFEDGTFDIVLSNEVLEHVMNYPEFIAENRRVQKADGVSLHIFPGPWPLIELHTYVPLAAMHRSYPWLLLWAALGIRNEFQRGVPARQTARRNYNYLRTQTNYVGPLELRRLFRQRFSALEFREDLFLELSTSKRGRWLNRLIKRLPVLLPVYRNMHNRVLLARS